MWSTGAGAAGLTPDCTDDTKQAGLLDGLTLRSSLLGGFVSSRSAGTELRRGRRERPAAVVQPLLASERSGGDLSRRAREPQREGDRNV